MEGQLKICTFNVRNDNLGKNLTNDILQECYSILLKKFKFDILATQEMIYSTLNHLKKEFPTYRMAGHSRYGESAIINQIKTLKKYNEYATIITKFSILREKTISLPWLPTSIKDLYHGLFKYRSITPRVLTDIIVDIDGLGRLRILNMHLDCHMNTVRRRQLNYILNYIKASNLPVILLGDFNSNLKNKLFQKFIRNLDSLGLQRVEYNHKTFHKSKKDSPIDHIFVPKEYMIDKVGIIENDRIKQYSDHYPLYAIIRKRNY